MSVRADIRSDLGIDNPQKQSSPIRHFDLEPLDFLCDIFQGENLVWIEGAVFSDLCRIDPPEGRTSDLKSCQSRDTDLERQIIQVLVLHTGGGFELDNLPLVSVLAQNVTTDKHPFVLDPRFKNGVCARLDREKSLLDDAVRVRVRRRDKCPFRKQGPGEAAKLLTVRPSVEVAGARRSCQTSAKLAEPELFDTVSASQVVTFCQQFMLQESFRIINRPTIKTRCAAFP